MLHLSHSRASAESASRTADSNLS